MTITATCQKRFDTLNSKQRKALYASPNSVLQVVAGPGTGKTHLITCRVAYLLTHHNIDPRRLIVTTFTKKASMEMKERLTDLLKDDPTIDLGALFIGTFHSICLKFLRIHGDKIGFKTFTIADEADQTELFKKAMDDAGVEPKDQKDFKKGYMNYISKQKALGLLPDECRPGHSDKPHFDSMANRIYELYQDYLKINGKMDFDDILLYTSKLFDQYPECTSLVQHVLIDEFQDTNTIQLKLLYQMVKNCNDNVTVVGDADQSIYGFRNAEYSNFDCMEAEFNRRNRNMIKVVLNENYRSTERILSAAEKLMRNQHQKRVPKELKTQSKLTTPMILTNFEQERHEADNIAALIKKYTTEGIEGKVYDYNDCAIICRMRKTFRMTEMALLHATIPYVIIKGTSFWEMREIKMATDVLRCVVSDFDWLSFKRILSWYVENLGPTSIASIENIVFEKLQSGQEYVNILEILKDVASGEEKVRATTKAKKNLSNFIERLETFRRLSKLNDICGDIDIDMRKRLFNNVITGFSVIQIATKIKTTKNKDAEDIVKDVENNVQEFRNQLCQFNPVEDEILTRTQAEMFDNSQEILKTNSLSSFLSVFLDEIYIYSTLQVHEEDEDNGKPRVTICTIHASKGLEWPVVFIPSLIDGVFPVYLNGADVTEEMANAQDDEERRCFYVAITRGKHVVHLSSRESDSGYLPVVPSKFIDEIGTDILMENEPIVKLREFDAEKHGGDSFAPDTGFISALDQYKTATQVNASTVDVYAAPIKIEELFHAEVKFEEQVDEFKNKDAEDTFSDGDTAILQHADDDIFSDDSDEEANFINELNKIKEKPQIEGEISNIPSSPIIEPVNTVEIVKVKKERKTRKKASLSAGTETKENAKRKKSKPNPKTIRPMYPSIDQFFKARDPDELVQLPIINKETRVEPVSEKNMATNMEAITDDEFSDESDLMDLLN